jgi:hypothetical protein
MSFFGKFFSFNLFVELLWQILVQFEKMSKFLPELCQSCSHGERCKNIRTEKKLRSHYIAWKSKGWKIYCTLLFILPHKNWYIILNIFCFLIFWECFTNSQPVRFFIVAVLLIFLGYLIENFIFFAIQTLTVQQ